MKIRVLGAHMFESSHTRLTSFLVDNALVIDAGGLTSALSFSEQRKVEHILLTHGHYDHIRDIPAIALKNQHHTIEIFAIQYTLDILTSHLINGIVYPKFNELPSPEKPSLRLIALEPYVNVSVGRYDVRAIPVNHAIPSVGYWIRDTEGNSFFYSGDTGPGLASCWEQINPQILFIETAFSNRAASAVSTSGHLCPNLLRQELVEFKRIKGYIPEVFLIHMNPNMEHDIQSECQEISGELKIQIQLAYEDMEIDLDKK